MKPVLLGLLKDFAPPLLGGAKVFYRLVSGKISFDYILFALHECLVTVFYGNTKDYHVFKIRESLNEELVKYFTECQPVKYVDVGLPLPASSVLLVTKFDGDLTVERKLDEIADLMPEDYGLFCRLHDEIDKQIRPLVKSPFCFVNTKAWKTKPSSERFGPNAPHLDGFMPGHLKVMVYASPLSARHGALQLGEVILTDTAPGTAVIFKNSDVLHSGIPGIDEERLSVEITIFRSFIYYGQFHGGHLMGRHYKTIFTPYLEALRRFWR